MNGHENCRVIGEIRFCSMGGAAWDRTIAEKLSGRPKNRAAIPSVHPSLTRQSRL
jgi:hypothetical protein